mmetsp:Transcript_72401/g.234246  ORF Transcript_72401/g.234246 Transcript_72401/m.234246 type:complete len:297 (+) Transcript_72401:669-1559(+)
MALPGAGEDRHGQHRVREGLPGHPRARQLQAGEHRGAGGGLWRGGGRGGGPEGHEDVHGPGHRRDGHAEHRPLRRRGHQAGDHAEDLARVPQGQDGPRGAEPLHAHWGDHRRPAHLARGQPHEPRQVPGLHGADPGRGEGALPRPQDQGQHAQVRPHLPLVLHRPGAAEEQGPHLPVPRQQVLPGLAHRLLLRRGLRDLRREAPRPGRGAVGLPHGGHDAPQEHRGHAGGDQGGPEAPEEEEEEGGGQGGGCGRGRGRGGGRRGGQEEEEEGGRGRGARGGAGAEEAQGLGCGRRG